MILEATMGSRRDREKRAREEKSGKKWSLTRKKKQADRKQNRVRELRELHDLSRVADVEIYGKIVERKKRRIKRGINSL